MAEDAQVLEQKFSYVHRSAGHRALSPAPMCAITDHHQMTQVTIMTSLVFGGNWQRLVIQLRLGDEVKEPSLKAAGEKTVRRAIGAASAPPFANLEYCKKEIRGHGFIWKKRLKGVSD